MSQNIQRPDWLRIVALSTFAFLIIYFFLFLFFPRIIPSSVRIFTPKNKINILIMGIDNSFDNAHHLSEHSRTDSLILAQINPFLNKINIISIPRDTLTDIPGAGKNRINAAYSFGQEKLAMEAVEELLGIHVDKFIVVNTRGFPPLIDSLGGLKIDVDKDMYYNDSWGGLKINLRKGPQMLNGEQAEGYVRFRHDPLGDISRVDRQKNFMKALLGKLASPSTIFRLPWILTQIRISFSTNLSPFEMLMAGNFMRMAQNKIIETYTLPGHFPSEESSSTYWFPDKEAIKTLLENIRAR